jgi:hypothetical protein
MIPKQPPKRTSTQPGIGAEDAIKRLDSAELKKVREKFKAGDEGAPDSKPPSKPEGALISQPPSSPRTRISREEEDAPPDSVPRSDRFVSAKQEAKEAAAAARPRVNSPPAHRGATAIGLGSKTHPQGMAARPNPNATGPNQPFKSNPPLGIKSPSQKPSAPRTTGAWSDESGSGPRRKPLAVDSVGDAATRIARTTARQTAPKLIASQTTIASAPIDSRTAFILSLVDGTSDVPGIVDASGMPDEEVIAILARLARLGLISVP